MIFFENNNLNVVSENLEIELILLNKKIDNTVFFSESSDFNFLNEAVDIKSIKSKLKIALETMWEKFIDFVKTIFKKFSNVIAKFKKIKEEDIKKETDDPSEKVQKVYEYGQKELERSKEITEQNAENIKKRRDFINSRTKQKEEKLNKYEIKKRSLPQNISKILTSVSGIKQSFNNDDLTILEKASEDLKELQKEFNFNKDETVTLNFEKFKSLNIEGTVGTFKKFINELETMYKKLTSEINTSDSIELLNKKIKIFSSSISILKEISVSYISDIQTCIANQLNNN